MNSYLVTGSAGFIGNCFVRMLLDEGHHVVSVDNLSYSGNMETIQDIWEHPHHKFVSCGIGDTMTIAHYLRDNKVRCVVNFAAESHVDRSIDMPLAFVKNNTVGTCSLLNNCHDYWVSQDKPVDFRFIQISTDEVFGSVQQGLFTEGMPYDPSSPYSASKAAAPREAYPVDDHEV
jgi:dTDP-glucose 4,6-dehydratase